MEAEKSKSQQVHQLSHRIIELTTTDQQKQLSTQETEEKSLIIQKLLAEKESHENTLKQLQEERQNLTKEKEKIASLSQQVGELVQNHRSTLKQLEAERENSRKLQEEQRKSEESRNLRRLSDAGYSAVNTSSSSLDKRLGIPKAEAKSSVYATLSKKQLSKMQTEKVHKKMDDSSRTSSTSSVALPSSTDQANKLISSTSDPGEKKKRSRQPSLASIDTSMVHFIVTV